LAQRLNANAAAAAAAAAGPTAYALGAKIEPTALLPTPPDRPVYSLLTERGRSPDRYRVIPNANRVALSATL